MNLCRICENRIDENGNLHHRLCKKHLRYRESKTMGIHLSDNQVSMLLRGIDISKLDESMDWLINDLQAFLDSKLDADIADKFKDFKGWK